MPRNPNKPRIPAIWNDYTMTGKPIAKTRLTCFKTPITSANMTPEALFIYLKKHSCVLGLVIDLTDTYKYYNANDFIALNVVYYKIRCRGMETPCEDAVEHFKDIVSKFFVEHHSDKLMIGVHCFNGVNRSGYLICRYLIDVLNWDPIKAISTFEEARGYQIEQHCMRRDLLSRKPAVKEKEKQCFVM